MCAFFLKLVPIAIVAFVQSVVLASAAETDRVKLLYRVAGVTDFGADNSGVATSFLCSNFSDVTEAVRVQVRDDAGRDQGRATANIPPLNTVTFSTHATSMFTDDVNLGTGGAGQGLGVIWGTSDKIICSAVVVDATSNNAFPLHMVRFNPLAGTQE